MAKVCCCGVSTVTHRGGCGCADGGGGGGGEVFAGRWWWRITWWLFKSSENYESLLESPDHDGLLYWWNKLLILQMWPLYSTTPCPTLPSLTLTNQFSIIPALPNWTYCFSNSLALPYRNHFVLPYCPCISLPYFIFPVILLVLPSSALPYLLLQCLILPRLPYLAFFHCLTLNCVTSP